MSEQQHNHKAVIDLLEIYLQPGYYELHVGEDGVHIVRGKPENPCVREVRGKRVFSPPLPWLLPVEGHDE